MIYRGRSEDGSDMEVVQGMYVNPNNPDEWSNKPYITTETPEERQLQRTYDEVLTYMSGRYTLDDVYQQITNKIIKKSRRFRVFVLSHYDSNGKFIK